MRRWHEDFTVSKREWKKHHRSHVESNKRSPYSFGSDRIGKDPYEVDCPCDEQIGRFRKKDAWDCGKTQCYICHGDKYPKREKTRQELRSDISFEEQLKEQQCPKTELRNQETLWS